MTRCFSDSVTCPHQPPPSQRGTRGQYVEKSPVARSPCGQKLLQALGLSEDFPAVPGLSKAAIQQGGQLGKERCRQHQGSRTNSRKKGSRLSVRPPCTSEHLNSWLHPLPKKTPILRTYWELGFSVRTVTPKPDKRDGRSYPCLCPFVTVLAGAFRHLASHRLLEPELV